LAVSRIWQTAQENYCYFESMNTDWEEAYYNTLKKVTTVQNFREYIRVLEEFRALLCDGHGDGQIYTSAFQFMNDRAILPFELQFMGDSYVVTATADRDIPLGSILFAVENQNTSAWLEKNLGPIVSIRTPLARENRLARRFAGYFPLGTELRCTFVDPAGQTFMTRVKAGLYQNTEKLQLTSGVEETVLFSRDPFQVKALQDGIIYVQNTSMADFSYWNLFCKEILPLLEGAPGVILDFRKNDGGNSLVGSNIISAISGKAVPDHGSLETLYSLRSSYDMTYYELLTGPLADKIQFDDETSDKLQGISDRGKLMEQGAFRMTEEQYDTILNFLGYPESLFMFDGDSFINPDEYEPLRLIILIGPRAGSAVDTVVQQAKDMGIPVLGTRTAGYTGDMVCFELGNGITSAFSSNYIYNHATQTPVNNYGIEASVYMDYDLADIRRNVDTQLFNAWRYLTEQS